MGKRINIHVQGWLSIVLICIFVHCNRNHVEADLVLKNGKFYTVCQLKSQVQAIAIKSDRILYTGSNREIDRFVGEKTRIIDLEGQFGCPGFNDAHVHLFEGGYHVTKVDLRGIDTIREIQRRILRAIRRLSPGGWIIGQGWDQNLFPGGQWPTRRSLDVVSPNVPIFLERACGHSALVNRKALQIAGIDKDTPNPPGGEIVKDPITGNVTGILKESAVQLVSQYIPPPSEGEMERAVETALGQIAQFGITSIQDLSPKDAYDIYEKFLKNEKLTCRVSIWFPLQEDLEPYLKLHQKYKSPMLRFGILQGACDGNMGSYTAYFQQPYSDEPWIEGLPQMSREDLNYYVINTDRAGYQMGIHAAGDRAITMVLDALTLSQRVNGARDSRHRIEGVRVINQHVLSRFNELGVVASMQPISCVEDIHWAEKRIGMQRCRYTNAWKSLKSHGAILAFGTDWPYMPLNPMLILYTAITRQDTSGYPPGGWFPEEELTVKEAIEAFTLGSAYAEFMEKEKGSLEPGKLADIVILDQNLLEIPPEEILQTEVVYTILGGKVVYQRSD